MKMINRVALANTKYHKGKNLLSGIAIILTSVLVFLITSIGLGVVNVQNAAVNKVYPTWHAMYRQVSEENMGKIAQHDLIGEYGLRQDVGESVLNKDDFVLISYLDNGAQKLAKQTFTKGHAPKKGNDAVLSRDALKTLGYPNAKIGDTIKIPIQIYEADGMGLQQEKTFRLTGFSPDIKNESDEKIFSMLVSKDFMEEVIPKKQRSYRMMIRLNETAATSTDAIKEQIKEIGKNFDVTEDNIVENSDYLFANYIDPAFYSGMAIIVGIILIAGALTIYSIYYVSLINKVQEFGKLAALGATKRQIRQIILRENLIVAGLSIPAGLLIGIAAVKFVFFQLISSISSEQAMTKEMRQVLDNGEVSLILPWIIAMTIGVTLLTVILASLKPMRQASKIMPIEAMRYTGQMQGNKKQRKGFIDLNLRRLANANLSRNKKRTMVTIFSLGMIGILFVVISTVFSCMNPKQAARDTIAEDYCMSIASREGDKMRPELKWTVIQQNNPLNNKVINKIKAIDGVEKVDAFQSITGEVPSVKDPGTDKPMSLSIGGISKDQMALINRDIEKGHATYEELNSGDKVIATGYILANYPEIKIGDTLTFKFFDGDRTFEKDMTIIGGGSFAQSVTNFDNFLMSNEAIKKLSKNNLTYYVNIKAAKGKIKTVQSAIENIEEGNELFRLESYEEVLKQWEDTLQLTAGAGYAIMLVLAIVGIMNLINTTIDSILSRKKELGVMQAIGMSNQQMKKMLRTEGFVYAGGIILLAGGLGSILGYLVYLYAESHSLMQIKVYQYPLIQVLLMIFLVVIVQLILTYATTTIVNKETVIKRIQASE
ncbi:ABC transporter permease [Enterococcus avium]|uniref:ABC transporter permease n=2 Tax=Enterococcus avium TaxID=33945 RepID=A0ABD5F5N6_ENTAV|nr:ABC transporter permease [Enterococcus avium]MDT2398024.1 ABC transporter permease [Enterococcus avium]MDT2434022.1 ABC transporter permease [Enterococcus avium]MDT2448419.1 ABC transporter permease [Enterococcus avium]MDT2464516.1 ABC transporter permease [Enterococcus avium]MDT2481939.1 ABC transporter permease [Enterococcus avium]